jgi:hypothetical protein
MDLNRKGRNIVEKSIFKVDNPVYLSKDEITEKYWNHQVLLTNIEMAPKNTMAGGIVRYYSTDAMKELWGVLKELNKAERKTIGCCSVEYIGNMPNIPINLYIGGSDS